MDFIGKKGNTWHLIEVKDISNLPTKGLENSAQVLMNNAFTRPDDEYATERRDGGADKVNRISFIVVHNDDEVAGCLGVYYSSTLIENKLLTIGGISGVIVREDFRNRGIASEMMRFAMAKLEELEADIVFLYGAINREWLRKFYEKFGFNILKNKYYFKGKSGKIYEEEDGMLALLNIDKSEIYQNLINGKESLFLHEGRW